MRVKMILIVITIRWVFIHFSIISASLFLIIPVLIIKTGFFYWLTITTVPIFSAMFVRILAGWRAVKFWWLINTIEGFRWKTAYCRMIWLSVKTAVIAGLLSIIAVVITLTVFWICKLFAGFVVLISTHEDISIGLLSKYEGFLKNKQIVRF